MESSQLADWTLLTSQEVFEATSSLEEKPFQLAVYFHTYIYFGPSQIPNRLLLPTGTSKETSNVVAVVAAL